MINVISHEDNQKIIAKREADKKKSKDKSKDETKK